MGLTTVLAVVLAAEYVFAPINLWTGRTLAVYRRYTGLPVQFARWALAPVKLATAAMLLLGLMWQRAAVARAAVSIAICLFYLFRLARPGGRDGTRIAAFSIFGAPSVALLVLQAGHSANARGDST